MQGESLRASFRPVLTDGPTLRGRRAERCNMPVSIGLLGRRTLARLHSEYLESAEADRNSALGWDLVDQSHISQYQHGTD